MIYIEEAVAIRLGYVPSGASILKQPLKKMPSIDFIERGDVVIVFKTQDKIRQRLAGRSVRILSFESGFFKDSYVLDAHGVFEKSSLNMDGVLDRMRDEVSGGMLDEAKRYKCEALPSNKSRLAQVNNLVPADDGFVLIPDQVQSDSKVKSVTDPVFNNRLSTFFSAVISHFANKVCIIKKHPEKRKAQDDEMAELTKRYPNCIYGDFSLQDSIARCRLVVTYNSLLAFDAMQTGKPVIQMAPGYLYTYPGCVAFCNDASKLSTVADKVIINEEERLLVTAFALGRYCFRRGDAAYIDKAISGTDFWTQEIT